MKRTRTNWTENTMRAFCCSKMKDGKPFIFHRLLREDGKLKGVVSCPNHPNEEYAVVWNYFTRDRAENGGCTKCGNFGTGKHSQVPLEVWAQNVGLQIPADYQDQKHAYVWTCVAKGHKFSASYTSIDVNISRDASRIICPACEVEMYENLHHVSMDIDFPVNFSRTVGTGWACLVCDRSFQKSLAKFSRDEHPCTNEGCAGLRR